MHIKSAVLLPIQVMALLFLSFSVAVAQTTEQCRALFTDALSTAATACAGLERNTACYGADTVTAAFSDPVPDAPFAVESDRADIEQLQSLSTSPANSVDGTLGIGVIRIQANLSDNEPDESVLFVVLGGQEIESGVEPQSVLNPLQSFYLPSPVFEGDCAEEIPPMVFIQSPLDTSVDLVVYGIPVQLDGTIIVRITPATDPLGQRLEFVVLDGELVLNPGAPNEIVVPAGNAIGVPLSDVPVSLGIEGDDDELQLGDTFTSIRVLTPEEIEMFNVFGTLPATILNYDFLAEPPETPPGTTPPPPPPTTGGGVIGGGPVPVTPVCGNFGLTSPLNGMAYGMNTVYWNPAQSVSGYTVTVTNLDNGQVTSVSVGAGATNAQIDTSTLGNGVSFQLSVAALSNGNVVCQQAQTMQRSWPPPVDDDDDDDVVVTPCPPGQQPSGVGGVCAP